MECRILRDGINTFYTEGPGSHELETPKGKGELRTPYAIYRGVFDGWIPNGQFSVVYKGGDTYVGEIKDGLRNGKGKMVKKTETYDGEWSNNLKHGHGVCVDYANNTTSSGEWKNDNLFSGKTTYRAADGTTYTASTVDGVREELKDEANNPIKEKETKGQ